jgi:hypothetical protein
MPSVPLPYSGADARHHLRADENMVVGAMGSQTRPRIDVRGAMNRVLAVGRRLDGGWQLALWLLVTLRIGLGLVAVFSVHLIPSCQCQIKAAP